MTGAVGCRESIRWDRVNSCVGLVKSELMSVIDRCRIIEKELKIFTIYVIGLYLTVNNTLFSGRNRSYKYGPFRSKQLSEKQNGTKLISLCYSKRNKTMVPE